jgi:RNA polymerase sigma factor (sigma-70 family)
MATAQLGAVLKHIRNLVADHQRNEQSDQDLLCALVTGNDQRAFEILLRRYGPMVLRVCRRVLGHEQDAEDVFQATFLVLARQAASIRKRKSLASWLHGVAYCMANNARRAAARRRKHERRAMPAQPIDPALTVAWQEIQVLLDEEVAHLPETLRGPFLLCCLENRKASEVAHQLGLEEGTIWKRLSRARKLLRERLARRGLSLVAALTAAAAAATRAEATLPSRLISMTVKAATAAPAVATGLVSPNIAALMKGATLTVIFNKFKIATTVLLATGLVATGLGALGRQALAARQQLGAPAHERVGTSPPRENVKPTVAKEDDAKDAVTFTGRVLDPDGMLVADAKLHLIVQDWRRKPLQVQTTSGPWRRSWIVAVAEGFGPAMSAPGELASSGDLTLRLAKDDVPIQGRILDLEGKPIAGVTVRVDELSRSIADFGA